MLRPHDTITITAGGQSFTFETDDDSTTISKRDGDGSDQGIVMIYLDQIDAVVAQLLKEKAKLVDRDK